MQNRSPVIWIWYSTPSVSARRHCAVGSPQLAGAASATYATDRQIAMRLWSCLLCSTGVRRAVQLCLNTFTC